MAISHNTQPMPGGLLPPPGIEATGFSLALAVAELGGIRDYCGRKDGKAHGCVGIELRPQWSSGHGGRKAAQEEG